MRLIVIDKGLILIKWVNVSLISVILRLTGSNFKRVTLHNLNHLLLFPKKHIRSLPFVYTGKEGMVVNFLRISRTSTKYTTLIANLINHNCREWGNKISIMVGIHEHIRNVEGHYIYDCMLKTMVQL